MPFYDAIRIGSSAAVDSAFTVDRSLRFNDDDSAYLNRTLGTATDRNRFTFSFWVKRSNLGTSQRLLVASDGSASTDEDYGSFFFTSSDQIKFSGNISDWRVTTQKFRDISSWYHIVLSVDTDQSTASNRIKIYVNGSEITSFSTSNNPSSGTNLAFNHSYAHYIGRLDTSSDHFDGYMAEINFIDGLQLTPSSFGETDATTGQWIPKDTSGLTFGTNGFRLQFGDNSGTTATTLGKDSSGNSNNFTPNNFSVSAGAGNDSLEDTPTNNFATFNPLIQNVNTFSEGNLQVTMTSNAPPSFYSTMGVSSGKYYMEFLVKSNSNYPLGISGSTQESNYFSLGDQIGFWLQNTNTRVFRNGSNITANSEVVGNFETGVEGTSTTWAVDDIAGLALDMDNKIIYLYKGATQVGYVNFSTFNYDTVFFGGGNYINGHVFIGNFGQRTFAHTPPTGYKSLCSANLPDPTILLPDRHFDTFTYSGDGNSTQTLSNVLEFQPDWVWLKGSNTNYSHTLYDSRRGAGSLKGLNSNETRPEGSTVQDDSTFGFLSSFDANGITVTKGSDSTSYTNGASSEYVAWNWLAGGADSKTYKVKVVPDSTDYGHGTGSNKYQFFKSDGTTGFGTNAVDLDLEEGGTYVFDWSDSSAQSHPLRFSLTNDGTHSNGTSAGTEYTTGVTKDDSAYKTTITIASGVANLFYYCQNHSGMGAEINTNSTKGSTNFDGSLLSVVKANTTAGFSITSFTVSSSAAYTVGHGLGVAPRVIIMKSRTQTFNWDVFHASVGNTKRTRLNDNTAPEDYTGPWNDTDPTSTVFSSVGSWLNNSSDQIAYIFSEVAGYSKFGSYTGNGSTDGTFVFLGFRPSFVLQRRTDSSGHWYIFDNKRAGFNVDNKSLSPDLSASQYTVTVIDFLSNGFKLRSNAVAHNASGGTYLYIAFAESPFKNARAR